MSAFLNCYVNASDHSEKCYVKKCKIEDVIVHTSTRKYSIIPITFKPTAATAALGDEAGKEVGYTG